MKSALIKDALFYEWLIENMYENLREDPATLEEMVIRTCSIKRWWWKRILPSRRQCSLKSGHTIGHAIEKIKTLKIIMGSALHRNRGGCLYFLEKRNAEHGRIL